MTCSSKDTAWFLKTLCLFLKNQLLNTRAKSLCHQISCRVYSEVIVNRLEFIFEESFILREIYTSKQCKNNDSTSGLHASL